MRLPFVAGDKPRMVDIVKISLTETEHPGLTDLPVQA